MKDKLIVERILTDLVKMVKGSRYRDRKVLKRTEVERSIKPV